MKLSMEYQRLRDPDRVLKYVCPSIEPYDHLVMVCYRRLSTESYVAVAKELRHWCVRNFGPRGDKPSRQWNYEGPSNFGFRTSDQAMLFMTIWNGYEVGFQ
jgi:hypothetical protein